ncbi:hypothetical protein BSNK01_15100 [Bacillaceae bacterium]
MAEVIANLIALFSAFPFLSFFLVYYAVKWRTRNRRLAVNWAVNVTTLLLFVSVGVLHGLVRDAGTTSLFVLLLTFVFVSAGLIAWLQMRIKGRIDWRKLSRAVWRLTFLALCITYVILFFSGIVHYVKAA